MKTVKELYGCDVFNDAIMAERLPKTTYRSLRQSIDLGLPLQPEVADVVASVMKDWATEKGATHFTHWFQPMTGITAGKHESFLCIQKSGNIQMEFSGKELIKGEPDASSFPNGGLRNTFEARGYTVWDCTSPAFIMGTSLYIPTAFCSYNGDALDTKTPLLRSMEELSHQALRILRLFGNTTSSRVTPTVGAEQEYFLIDREMYEKRLDLKICGRTLFGAKSPKGQEMDDHYCGRIRIRIDDYMRKLDESLWRLGIPAKTKHNEVAPAQHELAPLFESCNVAADHNQLIMERMRVVAKQNGLACLLHEKPFAHVNGSGKHNNWSMQTDDGLNLLDPGNTPYENIQFLLFLCAVIQGVDRYPELLRMTTATPGNDSRLGGNEAPPHVISIFLGEHLTKILMDIASGDTHKEKNHDDAMMLKTKVNSLPNFLKDDNDRNRTSPFAFTGNKFEFRMVGSSSSVSKANIVLNTIVADSLKEFADQLEHAEHFDQAIQNIIADVIHKHGRVIFNGNGYTKQWCEKAKELGLPSISDTVEAAKAYTEKKNQELFARFGVFTPSECQARYEIMLEHYANVLNIEATTMLEMVHRLILPAIIRHTGKVAYAYNQIQKAGLENASLRKLLSSLSAGIEEISSSISSLENALHQAEESDLLKQAEYYRDHLLPIMNRLREQVDHMELLTGKADWPVPSCTDMLYRV